MISHNNTVSDVYNRQLGKWSPSLKHLIQSTAPLAHLPDLPETLSSTGIRIGQLWKTNSTQHLLQDANNTPTGTVFEIRGWLTPTIIAIQLWTGKDSERNQDREIRQIIYHCI